MRRRLARLLILVPLTAALLAWAAYWTRRFFDARKDAEAGMDELQRLMSRGYFSPALDAKVTRALGASHEALVLALGGPVAIVLAYLLLMWLWMPRGDG